MFEARPSHIPISILSTQGFSGFGDTESTIEGAVAAVANALSQYLRSTSATPTPIVTRSVVQPTTMGGISPIWLIGGGVLAWYIIKKYKGKKEVI